MRLDVPSLAVALCVAAVAQDSKPATVAADERVAVTLKNGESLLGVAPKGVKNERLVAGRFLASQDPSEPKTGIRVWYYRDLDGYVFLEHRQIEKIEVLGRLTAEQSRELAEAIGTARRGADEARRRANAKRSESRPTPPEEGDEPAPTPAKPEGLTDDEKALLADYPPEEGWSAEKFGELKRRSIVLDIYPNAKERGFIDRFAEWQKAQAKLPPPDVEKK